MKKILLVDDEVQILKSLSRAFMDTDYEITTADNGFEALKIIDSEDIDLIISDMRMPLMDGYELLSEVKQRRPKIIRIILSGYSDEITIFKAILNNVAKVYLLKPWDNEKLISHIEHLFNVEAQLREKNLLSFIESVKLVAMKSSINKILSLIENDNSVEEISNEIEKEPAICAKLLNVANSALDGSKIGSIDQAVNIIGLQNLKSLLFSVTVIDCENISDEEKNYIEKLWFHSVLTNKILNCIYHDLLKKSIPEAAIYAGLLHNIGEFMLLKYSESERINYGISHQELGGYVVNWWGLPFQLVEVALYHHTPLTKGIINTELTDIIYLAQFLAYKVLGDEADDGLYKKISEKNNIDFLKLYSVIEKQALTSSEKVKLNFAACL